jgi:glycosyltransferase involved in cell wall biosynthesis
MISNDTLFVLGAGASAPYGYPKSSGDLKDDICLNFKTDMIKLLDRCKGDYLELGDLLTRDADDFIEHFQNSRIQSIDKWLSHNDRYREIGKLAIVNAIVKCEDKSQVTFEGKDKSLDWFSMLFNEMMVDVTLPHHFSYHGAYFITFNYDRVFEHLLYESFKNTFSEVKPEKINEILFNTTIIHIYGCIDDPPWKKGGYKYGESYGLKYLDEARKRIKIVGENVAYSPRLFRSQADLLLRSAKKIFFLGFGYDKQNLEILGIPQRFKDIPKPPSILGTGQGLLSVEIKKIKLRLGRPESVIEACDCKELLRKNLTEQDD